MILLDLLWGFLKVGCLAFGGGYGAIPLIRDVVLSYGWLDEELLTYMIAVSESTPGPIMVNLATYIGSSQAGLLGALVATLAVILPSFVIILLVMGLLKATLKNNWVQAALGSMKPCIIGIILATGGYMCWNHAAADIRSGLLTLVLAAVLFGGRYIWKKKPSPIVFIILSGLAGMIAYGI